MRDLRGLTAALGDLPDVINALHHLRTTPGERFLIRHLVGDVVNLTVAPVPRPQVVALVTALAQPGELLRAGLHEPQVHGVTAAIMLARPNARMPRECELRTI